MTSETITENKINTNEPAKKKGLGVEILEKPKRILPSIIEELLDKNISVILSKDGYFIEGFYGLNENIGKKGFVFAQETNEDGSLIFLDARNSKHVVKNFEELVRFNNHVWGQFFKQDEYQKPDTNWLSYMLEYDVLSLRPGK